jgi:glyoxylate reductase
MEAVVDARGLLCMLTDQIDSELLDRARRLEVVSQMAVGVDNIDVAACRERGIAIGHTPDVLTETVADTAFALLASIVRRLPEGEREVRAGEWGPWEIFHLAGGDLHGTTLGIVGMGRIGQAVARRAEGFAMEVIYASPHARGVPAEHVALTDLLNRADHVVLCPRLDETTRGLISGAELALMKPTAYLVNVSRGPVVDTGALVTALEERQIAGVALDVTDPEPLAADHPLLAFENCLVVPHIASASVRTRRAMSSLAVDNLLAGLRGAQMPARYNGYQ